MLNNMDNLLVEVVKHLVARVFGCSVQSIRDMNNERPRSCGLGQGVGRTMWFDGAWPESSSSGSVRER